MSLFIKLSRSTVERYIQCPRCCYLDKKYNIRPPSLPFTLNIAVDNLCKNEFDYYRNKQEPHPLFIHHEIDAVPFKHKNIDMIMFKRNRIYLMLFKQRMWFLFFTVKIKLIFT